MKRFVICLIAVLLFCGCKSTKTVSDVQLRSDIKSDVSYSDKSVRVDTATAITYHHVLDNIRIEEETIVTEYDKESGKPTKETKTKRTIVQDTDKVDAKEENQRVTECNQLSADQSEEQHEMVDAKTEAESVGGQESFGKWLGIIVGIGCLVGVFVLIAYLRKKLR